MDELLNKVQKKELEHPDRAWTSFTQLYQSYMASLENDGIDSKPHKIVFETLLEKVEEQIKSPYPFQCYHQKITYPFDYYRFGVQFMLPLVDLSKSQILPLSIIEKIENQIEKGENVVLFANHQTEVDPQLISIALESLKGKRDLQLAEEIIFVAGDRVVTDPLAIPFSLGRNLLCIYSKRHIENPPEKKLEKQHHNQRTMKKMRELFSEGGRCVYVAPSGGRDRATAEGVVPVADFDPQSIEMFRLMAQQAKRPTHFYPLALATYAILPPPQIIQKELGEFRKAQRGGIFFSFGDEIDMNHFPGSEVSDRHERRAALSNYIWNLVNDMYNHIKQL